MADGPLSRASSDDKSPSSYNDNRAACQSRRRSTLQQKLRIFSAASIRLRLRRSSQSCECANLRGSPVRNPSTYCLGRTFLEVIAILALQRCYTSAPRNKYVPAVLAAPLQSQTILGDRSVRIADHVRAHVNRTRPDQPICI